jgi:hypothetical protein
MNADGFYFKQLPFCFIRVYLRLSAAELGFKKKENLPQMNADER